MMIGIKRYVGAEVRISWAMDHKRLCVFNEHKQIKLYHPISPNASYRVLVS